MSPVTFQLTALERLGEPRPLGRMAPPAARDGRARLDREQRDPDLPAHAVRHRPSAAACEGGEGPGVGQRPDDPAGAVSDRAPAPRSSCFPQRIERATHPVRQPVAEPADASIARREADRRQRDNRWEVSSAATAGSRARAVLQRARGAADGGAERITSTPGAGGALEVMLQGDLAWILQFCEAGNGKSKRPGTAVPGRGISVVAGGWQPPLPNIHGVGSAVAASLLSRRADLAYVGRDRPLMPKADFWSESHAFD
jgi:hypothetical protein